MLALLTIVSIAVVCLMFAQSDRRRPVGLALVGMFCLVLGGRAGALLGDSYSEQLIHTVAAQEVASPDVAVDPPAAASTEPTPSAETTSSENSASENPAPANDLQAEVNSDDEMLDGIDEPAATDITNVEPHKLEIEPIAQVKFLTERPNWVETEPRLEGDEHQLAVASGYEVRAASAERALLEQLEKSLDRYINDHVGSEYAANLMGHEIGQTKDGDQRVYYLQLGEQSYEIGRAPFEELVEFPFGVMNQAHLRVSLDEDVRNRLDQRWSEIHAMGRLLQTGLGAGFALLVLGTVFSYFRLDTATRGYYTGRLQFGASAAILAVIVAFVLLAKWIPWL